MSDLTEQRIAIVTGGSGGIGRAVVERLAAQGMSILVHFGGNEARAAETVEGITASGGRASAFRGDVADEREMAALFAHAEQLFGGVDVVVNTAGIMLLSPVADLSMAEFDKIHRTNVRGTFVVSQLAARTIRAGGALINFSSSVTRLQQPAYATYAASKAAVETMTLVLAREMRGRDMTVNCVAPGPTATPLFLSGKSAELISGLASLAPLGRLGTPADIAQTVAFLAGPDGRWTNGQVLYANGGLT